MKTACLAPWPGLLIAAGLTITLPAGPAAAQFAPAEAPPAPFDPAEAAQVLTRGPVHEAYAEPVGFDPRPGLVVPKEPPPPVEESPPEQRPEEADVRWIPGYWAWDDSRDDLLWVCGVWRDIPPGRQWVPGYWSAADGGFRWVPGVWDSTAQEDVQYYPEPPQTLEAGPTSPPPTPDSVWSPGHWAWQGDRYAWRPGFWVTYQPDWVWVPAHYAWTPGGCPFVDGYWDHPLSRRGTPFAPVHFAQPVYRQPRFVYTPTVGLVTSALAVSFFVRPNTGHFYFGDYYAPNDVRAGYLPWHSAVQGRRGPDPVFAHYAHARARQDPRWVDRLQDDYNYRRDHAEARPPRTYIEQQNIVNNVTVNDFRGSNAGGRAYGPRDAVLARPISQLAANPDQPRGFTRVDPARRGEMMNQAARINEFRQQRQRQERPGTLPGMRAPGGDRGNGLAMGAGPLVPTSQPRRAERFRSPSAGPTAGPVAETGLGRRSRASPAPSPPSGARTAGSPAAPESAGPAPAASPAAGRPAGPAPAASPAAGRPAGPAPAASPAAGPAAGAPAAPAAGPATGATTPACAAGKTSAEEGLIRSSGRDWPPAGASWALIDGPLGATLGLIAMGNRGCRCSVTVPEYAWWSPWPRAADHRESRARPRWRR